VNNAAVSAANAAFSTTKAAIEATRQASIESAGIRYEAAVAAAQAVYANGPQD
jgi:hypothetical protein